MGADKRGGRDVTDRIASLIIIVFKFSGISVICNRLLFAYQRPLKSCVVQLKRIPLKFILHRMDTIYNYLVILCFGGKMR